MSWSSFRQWQEQEKKYTRVGWTLFLVGAAGHHTLSLKLCHPSLRPRPSASGLRRVYHYLNEESSLNSVGALHLEVGKLFFRRERFLPAIMRDDEQSQTAPRGSWSSIHSVLHHFHLKPTTSQQPSPGLFFRSVSAVNSLSVTRRSDLSQPTRLMIRGRVRIMKNGWTMPPTHNSNPSLGSMFVSRVQAVPLVAVFFMMRIYFRAQLLPKEKPLR